MLRILFIGENWYGSNARSCAESLRRLGCDVLDIDGQTFFPKVTMLTSRIAARLLSFRLAEEFNRAILRAADMFHPEIFIAFKGNNISARTLRSLSSRGIPLYNYFPDTSAFTHGGSLPLSLPEYDCVFYTKPFWFKDVTKAIKLKAGYFLPHGYDKELHRPIQLLPKDIEEYGCDVSLIAYHTWHKEEVLKGLIKLRPDLDLRIWGEGWTKRCKSSELRRCIAGYPLFGESYVRGVLASRINLAIMSGQVTGASSGDLTTSRTYLIPASGGFMVHERNSEVLDLYREGVEIACFGSSEELAEQIDYYLGHSAEREEVARAGHARCVPAYSYDNRMAELLRWHNSRVGEGKP